MDAHSWLKRMIPMLSKAIGVRFNSVFNHIDRTQALFDKDREMGSFRAITAEEEAATASIMAHETKRYLGGKKFKA